MVSTTEKPLPKDIDAEWSVVGSCLRDSTVVDDVRSIVSPGDFFDIMAEAAFGEILAMVDAGKRLDRGILMARLAKSKPQLFGKENRAQVAELLESTPTAAHAEYHSEQVRDAAIRRRLLSTCDEAIRSANDGRASVLDALTRASADIEAMQERGTRSQVVCMRDVMHEVLDRIDVRRKSRGLVGIATGFSDIDRLCGGLPDGELIVLAARPGVGKTSLGMQIACTAAESGRGVLFVSLEMSTMQLTERVLSMMAGVDSRDLRSGNVDAADSRKIVEASNRLSEWPLYIEDDAGSRMYEIASHARRMRRQKKIDLLVVDYLQLIVPDNQREPRQEQVAKISRMVKRITGDCNMPVVCLAQLNRATEKSGKEPGLANLRESGAIEQDADQVWFIHRKIDTEKPGEFAKTSAFAPVLSAKSSAVSGPSRSASTPRVMHFAATCTIKTQAPYKLIASGMAMMRR